MYVVQDLPGQIFGVDERGYSSQQKPRFCCCEDNAEISIKYRRFPILCNWSVSSDRRHSSIRRHQGVMNKCWQASCFIHAWLVRRKSICWSLSFRLIRTSKTLPLRRHGGFILVRPSRFSTTLHKKFYSRAPSNVYLGHGAHLFLLARGSRKK